MKISCLIIGILFSITFARAQGAHISNSRQITNEANEYDNPKWSPDGAKILVTGHHKQGLFLVDTIRNGKVRKLTGEQSAGTDFRWSKNGTVNYSVRDGYSRTTAKSIHAGNMRISGPEPIDTLVFIDVNTLQIRARLSDNSKEWLVSQCEGNFYNPIISPDRKKVAANLGSDICVFPILGSDTYQNMGRGIVSSWSPDCKFLLAFIDESKDGYVISNSDFFLIDLMKGKRIQLTNSNDKIEMWPSFSPDGKRIAFSDEKSGQIFICDYNSGE